MNLSSVLCTNVDKCAKCQSEYHKETDPPKGKKKRLALRDIGNSSRLQFISKEDAKAAQKSYVPPNSERTTWWALKVFAEWKQAQKLVCQDCCPEDLLERADPTELA